MQKPKKKTLLRDVLAKYKPRMFSSFISRMAPEDQQELVELRIDFHRGVIGSSKLGVARALIKVGRERGWKLPSERQLVSWLTAE